MCDCEGVSVCSVRVRERERVGRKKLRKCDRQKIAKAKSERFRPYQLNTLIFKRIWLSECYDLFFYF